MLSPVLVFILFYVIVIILTALYHYNYPDNIKYNLFELDIISDDRFDNTISVFFYMLLFFCAGNIFYLFIDNKYRRLIREKRVAISLKKININIKPEIVILLVLILFGLYCIRYGVNGIFYRNAYMEGGALIVNLIMLFSVILVIVSIFNSPKYKAVNLLTFIVVFLLTISSGSRFAVLYVVLYGFFYANKIKQKKKRYFNIIILIFFSILFLGYMTGLRSSGANNSHGLVPYLMRVSQIDEILYSAGFNLYYTFVYGFFVTSETMIYTIPMSYIYTSLNPLPGSMTNWYLINMGINQFCPFSGIGEMAVQPFYVSFLYYFILGVFYSFFEKKIIQYLQTNKLIMSIIVFCFASLATIAPFEYNLRSAFRFVVYIFAVIICVSVFDKLKRKKQKSL